MSAETAISQPLGGRVLLLLDRLLAALPLVLPYLTLAIVYGWQASRHGEMRRPLSEIESRQARNIAREFALNLIE